MGWGVKVGAAIQEIRRLAENHKPMGEAGRNPQHVPILGRQSHPDPPAESGRAAPDINRNVINRSGYDTDEFPLRLLDLIVQAAQSMPSRATVIVLDEPGIDTA